MDISKKLRKFLWGTPGPFLIISELFHYEDDWPLRYYQTIQTVTESIIKRKQEKKPNEA